MNKVTLELDGQDHARLDELSTFFECSDPEALIRSIRLAHNALCGSPDAMNHRAVLQSVSASRPWTPGRVDKVA